MVFTSNICSVHGISLPFNQTTITTIQNSKGLSLALLLPTLSPRLLLLTIRLRLRSSLLLLRRRRSLRALGLLHSLHLSNSDCRLGLAGLLALAVLLSNLDLRNYNLLSRRRIGFGLFAGNLLAPALLLLGLLLLRRLGGIGLGVASLAACVSCLAALDIRLVLLVVEAAEVIGCLLLLFCLDGRLVDVLVVLDGDGGRLAV